MTNNQRVRWVNKMIRLRNRGHLPLLAFDDFNGDYRIFYRCTCCGAVEEISKVAFRKGWFFFKVSGCRDWLKFSKQSLLVDSFDGILLEVS